MTTAQAVMRRLPVRLFHKIYLYIGAVFGIQLLLWVRLRLGKRRA